MMFRREAAHPSGIPLDLWGQRGWPQAPITGESYHAKDIEALFTAPIPDGGAEQRFLAQLLPEPDNRHDRNAVKVMSGTLHLGYLPREVAASYARVLAPLVSVGYLPQCLGEARAWPNVEYDVDHRGALRTRRTGLRTTVMLDLAAPHLLVPLNAPPAPAHVLLPVGGGVQVSGEELHMDVLRSWVRPEGEGWVYVTLHTITEQLARSVREVVEVRLDGARVGQLTPKMSSEYAPAIALLADTGRLTAGRALVRGNALKADVVLHAAKAGELDQDWLAEVVGPGAARVDAAPVEAATVSIPVGQSKPAASDAWPPPAAPAAWYPDPAGSAELRWWDGSRWTEHTHSAG